LALQPLCGKLDVVGNIILANVVFIVEQRMAWGY
jgi:hypothetical protein